MQTQEDQPPERPAEYPFSPWAVHLEKAVLKLKGKPRYCGMNAFRGLRRAWQIAHIDPEIALFKGITAEEEAATALMSALQRKRYPGAKKLSPWNHAHKAGLSPFLRVIESMIAKSGFPTPRMRIQHDGPCPRLDILLPGEIWGMPGITASPDEPLNIIISEGEVADGTSRVMRFEEQLQEYAGARGFKDMLTAVEEDANKRNRLLYAADNGLPVVQGIDAGLIEYQRPVLVMLTLTVAVLQTSMRQPLAVQALEAYLTMLGRLPNEQFDYEAAARSDAEVRMVITKQMPEGPFETVIERGAS